VVFAVSELLPEAFQAGAGFVVEMIFHARGTLDPVLCCLEAAAGLPQAFFDGLKEMRGAW